MLPPVSRASPITTSVNMDRASQVLAQDLPPYVSRTWAALSDFRAEANLPRLLSKRVEARSS
jgi:hypothetical protein